MTVENEFKVSMEDRKQTYVIIPAYNEETRVRPVIEAIADMGFKIILVNDGSTDGTLDILKDVQRKYPENIFIYSHVINRGVGLAMQTGFEAVLKHNPKYIVNIDADGQHSVDDLESVLEPLVTGRAEAVIGVRSLKDMPTSKNFGNSVMNILTHIFYGVEVSDSQTGFRALTKSALNKISINAQGYLISSEFIREINDNNIPFEEVTIETIYTYSIKKVILMFFYSLVFPIIAVLAILWFVVRVRNGKNTISTLVLWIILWVFLVLFALAPDVSMVFANLFGITRGLDFIFIVVFAVMAYIIFKLYYKLDKLENDINKMVKEIALANEISLSDDED